MSFKSVIKKTVNGAVYLCHRYFHEGFSYRAASLAYATLLAMVPLMMIGFRILSIFPFFQGVGIQLQKIILSNFVASSAEVISKHLDDFLKNIGELSTVNIIFLVLVALLMIYNINAAFNSVWHAKRRLHFSFSFLIFLVVLLVSPIVLGGVLVLGSFFTKLPYFNQFGAIAYVQKPIFFILPHVLIFLTFTLFNWVLPSCRVRLSHAAVGGLITTVIFELAKFGFTVYISHVPTYRLLYGTMATVPIFLVWLYVSWMIILLGALITNLVAVGIRNELLK